MRILPRRPRIRLSAAERLDVYDDRLAGVLPRGAPVRAPGQPPRLLLVTGQQGAGKSTTQRYLHAALGPDQVASYDGDDDAEVHPRYEEIARAYGREGHHRAGEAMPAGLALKTVDHLRAGLTKYDVIASPVLGNDSEARAWADGFREHGYRVSAVFVATNEAVSLLSIADRYQRGRDATGAGRWVDADVHDETYAVMPDMAHLAEAGGLADDIYVVDRDGNVLYENHRRADGAMEHPLGAREAMHAEQDRPPTPAEHEQFQRTLGELVYQRDPALPPLEPAVRDMALEAERREQARGEPRPPQHMPSPAPRIDQRLGGPAPVGAGGLDPSLLAAQRVAGDGVRRPSPGAPGDAARRPDTGPGRGGDALGPSDNRPLRGSPDRRGPQGSPHRATDQRRGPSSRGG